jgi:hypothetical protein
MSLLLYSLCYVLYTLYYIYYYYYYFYWFSLFFIYYYYYYIYNTLDGRKQKYFCKCNGITGWILQRWFDQYKHIKYGEFVYFCLSIQTISQGTDDRDRNVGQYKIQIANVTWFSFEMVKRYDKSKYTVKQEKTWRTKFYFQLFVSLFYATV